MPKFRKLAASVLYLALYLVADLAAVPHQYTALAVYPWNAGPAISIGFTARFGTPWLPLTLIAPLLGGLLDGTLEGHHPLTVVIRAVSELLASALAAYLLRRSAAAPSELGQLRGFFLFVATSVAAAALMALLRGVAEGFRQPLGQAANQVGAIFLAQVVAILSVTPVFLVHSGQHLRLRLKALPTGEILLQAISLGIIAWEVFGRFMNREIHFFYLLFLPFAWIATRHAQKGASLALAALYAAPVLTDLLFGHSDLVIDEMQIRMGVLALISLLFGAMVAERRQAESRIQDRQTELAHFQRLNVGWEMASALAHELNQPLTAAMNLTQAALRLLAAPSPDLERTAHVMRMSVDRIERVGQIIHGLREFMRKGELTLSKNLISDMTEDALRLVSPEANAAGIGLQTAGLQALPPVMADKTQVVQVLVNLVRNAIQSLAIAKTEYPIVVVSGQIEDDMMEITVTDNGPGLADDVMSRLFEPFVTTKPTGMGLGLSISKSILEAHEGHLWAENAPSGGAVFHLTLPLAERDAVHG